MSRAPSIGDVMIAIRDIEAPWIEQRHITVLSMLAARLPTIRPTQSQMARSTRMHRGTVNETLAELRVRKLIAYDIGGKHGRACIYTILLRNLRALIPEGPEVSSQATPGVVPGDRGVSSGTTLRSKARVKEAEPPSPPRPLRTPAPPAPSSPDGGRGGDASSVGAILAAYASAWRLAHGQDPTINGIATKHARALLRDVGLPGALLRIANASADAWWQSNGDLGSIVARVDRWATTAKPSIVKSRLQPLSERKGTA